MVHGLPGVGGRITENRMENRMVLSSQWPKAEHSFFAAAGIRFLRALPSEE